MQIKTQLEIKLSQDDINQAIVRHLAQHGYNMTPEEMDGIKYVNTRSEGITANLTVSNEQDTAVDTDVKKSVKTQEEPEPEPEYTDPVDPAEDEVIEANSVEDVMPSIDEIAATQTSSVLDEVIEGDASNEEEAAAPVKERKSLFAGAKRF